MNRSLSNRAAFQLPADQVYLDGGTFGPMPKHLLAHVGTIIDTFWSDAGNQARCGAVWHEVPDRIASKIARLLGVSAADILVGESLSIQVFQAISAALSLCSGPRRNVILTDSSIAQSDLHVMQALAQTLNCQLRVVEPERICYALGDDVAVLLMAEVDRLTGKRRDLPCLTRLAHEAGALTVWDLSHSVGATDLDLTAACADFAVGCTHKYLNGGPGSPAFIWIAPRFVDRVAPALQGGMGRQGFCGPHAPAPKGIERLRIGAVSLLALAALDAALDLWDEIPLSQLRKESLILSDAFIQGLQRDCPDLRILTPLEPAWRGSHISLEHPQAALIHHRLGAEQILAGFCQPGLLRFAFAPLYNTLTDIERALAALAKIMHDLPSR